MSQVPPWERKRKEQVKIEEETDSSYGCPPDKRTLDQYIRFGLINLDKPSGPSSHEVVAWAKRLLKLKHAGHGGTLGAKILAGAIQWSPVCYRSP